jgi:hypothetical protein
MKAIAATVLAALLAVTKARFLDTTTTVYAPSITFATTLNCGQCILGGYNFCVKQAEGATATADVAPGNQICCTPGSTTCSAVGTLAVE